MSRQMLISIGILILAFGSGIGVGLFMGSAPAASDASKKSTGNSSSGSSSGIEAQDRIQVNTLLSNRIRELEKELAERKANQSESAVVFFKRYQDTVGLQAFDDKLKITPEMTELLALTKEEKLAVEQHLKQVADELAKIDDANTILTQQTANSVTYTVAASPDGKALKDKLGSLLDGDIAPFRAELLMEPRQFGSFGPFSQFEGQAKVIEISWVQQDGHPRYMVTQSTPNGSMSSTSDNTVPPQFQKYLSTPSGQ